jgi:hypothetical protein
VGPKFLPLYTSTLLLIRVSQNSASPMGNKHISHRQSVRIYEFFIVFGYCAIEEILNIAYLPPMICPHFAALDEFYLLRKNDVVSMRNKTHIIQTKCQCT